MPETSSKIRVIIFTADSVRAIIAGVKTQTRRLVKSLIGVDQFTRVERHEGGWRTCRDYCPGGNPSEGVYQAYSLVFRSPFRVGQRLYVKESYRIHIGADPRIEYCAGGVMECDTFGKIVDAACADTLTPADAEAVMRGEKLIPRKRSPLFMPRSFSRITLEVTAVKCERLQEISKSDVIAEGIEGLDDVHAGWNQQFAARWDEINGNKTGCDWASSPFVFAVSSVVVKPEQE